MNMDVKLSRYMLGYTLIVLSLTDNIIRLIESSYQWLQGLEIFDLVIADAEMGQLRTFLESSESAADPVVAQLKPLQFRQLRETLQTGKKQTVAFNCFRLKT